jgi:hypothetical protein
MRTLVGLILGCALTFGGLYIADSLTAGQPGARPMVNWDVVATNVDELIVLAKNGWKKIAG